MDENLVGYLLHSLDADEHLEVETYLNDHPEEAENLERLRLALAPLAADEDFDEPPPGLVIRTLGRIAEHHCRKLPPAPPASPPIILPNRRSWRWVDSLVAAGILLCALTLLPSLAARGWFKYQIYSCANNLHKFHNALMRYSDTHEDALPKVEAHGPRSVAGIFVPILNDAGVLDNDVRLACSPLAERRPLNRSVRELEALYAERQSEFREVSRNLAGCYAYTLGYVEDHRLKGLRRTDEGGTPVLADCPPSDASLFAGANSPNHGGRGQNVLYLDGSVEFRPSRAVGLDADDIYVNRNNRVAAGIGPRDAALASRSLSPAPWPRDDE